MPKKRKPEFVVNSRFVAAPGWEKDYKDGMKIFLRMLEREAEARKGKDVPKKLQQSY